MTNSVKQQVKEILLEHRGANNPITSREINEQVELDNVGSFPSTRAVIRSIVLDDQIPIAGSSQGYYVIENEDELGRYLDNLDKRSINIMERKFAVLRAVESWEEKIVDEDSDLL